MWDFQAALDPRTPADALCLRTLVVSQYFSPLLWLQSLLCGQLIIEYTIVACNCVTKACKPNQVITVSKAFTHVNTNTLVGT